MKLDIIGQGSAGTHEARYYRQGSTSSNKKLDNSRSRINFCRKYEIGYRQGSTSAGNMKLD
jgi:hypothetical protein